MVKGQDKRMFPVLLLPNEEVIMEKINRVLLRERAVTAVLLVLVSSAGSANDGHDLVRFQATLQTTSLFVPTAEGQPPPAGCEVSRGEPVIGVLNVVGAGTSNLFLGQLYVQQRHCVRRDLTFFGGCFKLTKTLPPLTASPCSSGDSLLEGRYFGGLERTFNSKFPPPPPLGTWLIKGNVCILKVRGHTVNDCSQPPRRYEAASGISYQDTGAATIFLDQVIRFK
jgi:hypothetical protein